MHQIKLAKITDIVDAKGTGMNLGLVRINYLTNFMHSFNEYSKMNAAT